MKPLRKLLALVNLLRTSPQPMAAIRVRLRENGFDILSFFRGGKGFRYQATAGFEFACIPSSASSRHLYLHGYQEEIEASTVLRWLRPGDACIDVGANVGYFACLFADQVGTTGKVIAMEPAPRTFEILSRAVSMLDLPQLILENACALDVEKPVRFMIAMDDNADVEQSMRVDETQRDRFREVEVPGTTLDVLTEKYALKDRVAVVKIDVEGAEPLVLKGAARLFSSESTPLFIVEIHQLALANFQYLPRDVMAFFPPEKFSCYAVPRSISDATPQRQHGVPYAVHDAEKFDWPVYCNLIAIPRLGKFAARTDELAAILPELPS